MSWSSLSEDRLLVLEEEGGGEPVEYSSLQECQIWFENGELCHTLFHLFPCPASVLLSPAASPFPGHSPLQLLPPLWEK